MNIKAFAITALAAGLGVAFVTPLLKKFKLI